MAITIEFEVNLGGVTKRLKDIEAGADDIWEKVAVYIEQKIDQQFDISKDPANRQWAPLATSTLIKRRRLGITHTRPLIVTGKMRYSLRTVTTGDAITLTIDAPAVYHQFGTRLLPSRRIFPESIDEAAWSRDIGDMLQKEYFDLLK